MPLKVIDSPGFRNWAPFFLVDWKTGCHEAFKNRPFFWVQTWNQIFYLRYTLLQRNLKAELWILPDPSMLWKQKLAAKDYWSLQPQILASISSWQQLLGCTYSQNLATSSFNSMPVSQRNKQTFASHSLQISKTAHTISINWAKNLSNLFLEGLPMIFRKLNHLFWFFDQNNKKRGCVKECG